MSYVVFLFRVLVVYKSWKVSDKETKRLSFFTDENKVILVSNSSQILTLLGLDFIPSLCHNIFVFVQ
jgi:hypothetical protein